MLARDPRLLHPQPEADMLYDLLSQETGVAALGVILLVLLASLLSLPGETTNDVRAEIPKTLSSATPFIGHLLGFARNGHSYFTGLW